MDAMDALPKLESRGSSPKLFEERLVAEAPKVLALLRRLAGREAEDLAQEALARALRSRETYEASRPMGAWLGRIAYRVFLDHKARGARLPQPMGDAATALSDRSGPHERSSDWSEIDMAMRSLGHMEREILMRFHAANESIVEIAERMSMPAGTVKSHLHRARRRLARLEANDEGQDVHPGKDLE